METPAEQDAVWNVNFPAGEPKGILRDRFMAPVSMYFEEYLETESEDGSVTLEICGKPVSNDLIPEGSDAQAVRKGYISIGKVRDAAR